MIVDAPAPKPVETPAQRRSRQIDHAAALARDLASDLSLSAKADVIKPLDQKTRAQLKRRIDPKLRSLRSLMEGLLV